MMFHIHHFLLLMSAFSLLIPPGTIFTNSLNWLTERSATPYILLIIYIVVSFGKFLKSPYIRDAK